MNNHLTPRTKDLLDEVKKTSVRLTDIKVVRDLIKRVEFLDVELQKARSRELEDRR